MRELAVKFIDGLTYEVARNIEREMESINPIMAKYVLKVSEFSKFVWTFKDVPLPQN